MLLWGEQYLAIVSGVVAALTFINEIRLDITMAFSKNRRNGTQNDVGEEKKVVNSKPFCVIHMIILVILLGSSCVAAYYADLFYETAQGITGTTVNIEGLALTQVSHGASSGQKVWDPLDIAEPPAESTEFFITTKRVKTGPQNLGECIKSNKTCSSDSECAPDVLFDDYTGISTGTCVKGTCSVLAWCPTEYEEDHAKAHREYLNSSLNFYALIQSHNYILFNDGYSKRYVNVLQKLREQPTRCEYKQNDEEGRKCPYFLLMDIVNEVTDNNIMKYDKLVDKGGVIAIRLHWSCNTRHDECTPKYRFTRLDDSGKDPLKRGYSFTEAEYLYGNNSRTHVRSTGILFVVLVNASGYRLSWYKFIIFSVTAFAITKGVKPVLQFICAVVCCCYRKDCKK